METLRSSEDPDLVEEMLRFALQGGARIVFLRVCTRAIRFVRPDVVLELSWRHNLMNFAMPYMIKTFRQYENRISDQPRRRTQ